MGLLICSPSHAIFTICVEQKRTSGTSGRIGIGYRSPRNSQLLGSVTAHTHHRYDLLINLFFRVNFLHTTTHAPPNTTIGFLLTGIQGCLPEFSINLLALSFLAYIIIDNNSCHFHLSILGYKSYFAKFGRFFAEILLAT